MYHRVSSKYRIRGFTTIELLVVVALLSVVVTGAVDIFGIVSRAQKRIHANQIVQADIRRVMEIIARDVHTGGIDYQYYTDQGTVLAIGAEAQPLTLLALTDPSGQAVRYRFNSSLNQVEESRGTVNNWQTITSTEVVVQNLRFYVVPSSNPFIPCGSGGVDCSTVPNAQPRVTVVLSLQNNPSPGQPTVSMFVQTTVAIRSYQR